MMCDVVGQIVDGCRDDLMARSVHSDGMYTIEKVDQLPMVPVDDPQAKAETFVPAEPFHGFVLSNGFVVPSETADRLVSKLIGKAYKNKPDKGAAL